MFIPGKPFHPNLMFGVRLEPTLVKHLSGARLKGRLLASPRNIRLGWKGLPRTNTLAYYESVNYSRKFFKALAPGVDVIKLFTVVIYLHYMVMPGNTN